MTIALERAAGTYTQPAERTLQPPMWIVQTNGVDSYTLALELIRLGVHFGYQTWPDCPHVMVVVFAASPLRADVRLALEKAGQVRGWAASLDIDPDARWEEYRP